MGEENGGGLEKMEGGVREGEIRNTLKNELLPETSVMQTGSVHSLPSLTIPHDSSPWAVWLACPTGRWSLTRPVRCRVACRTACG